MNGGSYRSDSPGSPRQNSFPPHHHQSSDPHPPRPSSPMYSNLHEPSTSYSPPRETVMSTSPTHYAASDSSYNRRPPGLSSSPPGTNGSYFPSSASSVPMPSQRPRRDSFSVSPPASRSPPDAAFVSRRNSVDTRPPPPSPRTSPQDPRANPVPVSNNSSGRPRLMSISTRNVRWDHNLVCPSPVPLEERRKGWFNRRGYVYSSPSLPVSSTIPRTSPSLRPRIPLAPLFFCLRPLADLYPPTLLQ